MKEYYDRSEEDIDCDEIKEIIALDTFNDTSLFAVVVIDLSTYEVIYANKSMKNIMADMTAQHCWEAIHGKTSPCKWCKAPSLLSQLSQTNQNKPKQTNQYVTYENFNEAANKWYQLQEKVVSLSDGRDVLISFALDVSMQKEAQSGLIDMHVKLSKQTQELQKAHKELKRLANVDPLSDLYNRRYFNKVSKDMIVASKDTNEHLSIVMIDVDDFKEINDIYGHGVGDDVIKMVGSILVRNVKECDVVSRFGGEEFAIAIPHTDINEATKIANRIREVIEASSFEEKDLQGNIKTIHITVSIGVDEVDCENEVEVFNSLNRADKALYQAKKSGKNKVEVFAK